MVARLLACDSNNSSGPSLSHSLPYRKTSYLNGHPTILAFRSSSSMGERSASGQVEPVDVLPPMWAEGVCFSRWTRMNKVWGTTWDRQWMNINLVSFASSPRILQAHKSHFILRFCFFLVVIEECRMSCCWRLVSYARVVWVFVITSHAFVCSSITIRSRMYLNCFFNN